MATVVLPLLEETTLLIDWLADEWAPTCCASLSGVFAMQLCQVISNFTPAPTKDCRCMTMSDTASRLQVSLFTPGLYLVKLC